PRPGLLLPLDKAPVAVQREILALPVLHLATRPFHGQLADLTLLAEPEELARVVRRPVAAAALDEARLHPIGSLQHEARADNIAVLLRHQLDAQPARPAILVAGDVAQNHDRGVDVTDHQVGSAVVVEVAHRDAAAAVLALEVTPAKRGNLLKL